jgi:hypothetical protein
MENLNHNHTENLFIDLLGLLFQVLWVIPFLIIWALLQVTIVLPWIISVIVVLLEQTFMLIIDLLVRFFVLIVAFLGLQIGVAIVLFIESETQVGLILIGLAFGCCLVAAAKNMYIYDSNKTLGVSHKTLVICLNILFIGFGLFTFILGTGSYFFVGGLILLGIFGLSGVMINDDVLL